MKHAARALLGGVALLALGASASPLEIVAGKTFGGTHLGVVSFEFTFTADGKGLGVTAMWGSQPFMCSNLTVAVTGPTQLAVAELNSWDNLGTQAGLCVANGITTNSVSFTGEITVGPVVNNCGQDALNVCTTIKVFTVTGMSGATAATATPTYGVLWLLHQSFPIAREPPARAAMQRPV